MAICQFCKTEFQPIRKAMIYCSKVCCRRKWYSDNPGKRKKSSKEYFRKWSKNNPEKCKERSREASQRLYYRRRDAYIAMQQLLNQETTNVR